MRNTLALWVLVAAGPAFSQGSYEDGYRKGFQDGFQAGQQQSPAAIAPVVPASPLPVPVAPVYVAPAPLPAPASPGLFIINAFYGDAGRECNVTGALRSRVNGQPSASIEVNNHLCADPAPGVVKHLTVEYHCGRHPRRARQQEHRTLYLSCS